MMKWGKCIFLLGMLFVLSLSGCAKQPEQGNGVVDTAVKTEVNWEQGFAVGEVKQVQEWNTCDFQRISLTHTGEGDYTGGSVRTDNLRGYVETAVYKTEESENYYVKRFSPEGTELGEVFLDGSNWGVEDINIFAYDVVGDRMYFGIMQRSEEQSSFRLPAHVYIVMTDSNGKWLNTVDISAGLASLGCDNAPAFFEVDGDGYIYVRTWNDNQQAVLYVTDKEGKGVLSYQCDTPAMDSIFTPVRDNHGRLFIPIYRVGEKATLLLWKNSANQWQELARIEGKTVSDWYGMEDNFVYYKEGYMLVRWDVATGEGEYLLDLKKNDFESISGSCIVAINTEGKLYLRNCSMGQDWVVRVTSEALPYKAPLVFGTRSGGPVVDAVMAEAVMYSREYSVPVVVQDESDKFSESRMLMDMVNGKGPDIMCVSRSDMKNLQSNDALLDIGELIPEEVKESLLPQALASGTMDGELYGIPVDMNLHVMFANKELWNRKSWTYEEVFEVLEQNPQLEYIFTSGWSFNSSVSYLFIYDLLQGKSSFIDWEHYVSRFEEMKFHEVLEKLKPYEIRALASETDGGKDAFLSGTALGYADTNCGPFLFIYLMNLFGDNVHALGLPSEDGKGVYLEAGNYLVVNANVSEDKKEDIKGFLLCMLNEEVQREISKDSLSVIEGLVYDELEDNICYNESTGDYYYEILDNVRMVIEVAADGTAYMEDYKELIENAQVLTYEKEEVLSMIGEELQAFFSGERTAIDVTRKIDNRVQLYLDEQGSAR